MNMFVLTTVVRLSVKGAIKYEIPLQVIQSGPTHAAATKKLETSLEGLVEPFKTFGMDAEFTEVQVTYMDDYKEKEDQVMAKTAEARTALKLIRKNSTTLEPLSARLRKEKKSDKAQEALKIIEKVGAGAKVPDEKILMLGMLIAAFNGDHLEDLL